MIQYIVRVPESALIVAPGKVLVDPEFVCQFKTLEEALAFDAFFNDGSSGKQFDITIKDAK